jgi:hypothetical protein
MPQEFLQEAATGDFNLGIIGCKISIPFYVNWFKKS